MANETSVVTKAHLIRLYDEALWDRLRQATVDEKRAASKIVANALRLYLAQGGSDGARESADVDQPSQSVVESHAQRAGDPGGTGHGEVGAATPSVDARPRLSVDELRRLMVSVTREHPAAARLMEKELERESAIVRVAPPRNDVSGLAVADPLRAPARRLTARELAARRERERGNYEGSQDPGDDEDPLF